MAFNVGDAAIDLTLEGAVGFNSQCDSAVSRLNGLQGGLAATDTKAKNFLVTLREFSSGAGLSMLIRGGIYGILAAGAVEAFADMTREAKKGADVVDILSTGFFRLAESLPVIGRIAKGFRDLGDAITGAKEAKEILDKALAYKKETGEMEKDTKYRIALLEAENKEKEAAITIENNYQKSIKELREKEEKSHPAPGRYGYESPAVKLQAELDALERLTEYQKHIYHIVTPEVTPGPSPNYLKAVSEKRELLLLELRNEKAFGDEVKRLAAERDLALKKSHDKFVDEANKKAEEAAKKEEEADKKVYEASKKMEDYLTAGAGEKQKKIAEETAKYAETCNAATTTDQINQVNEIHRLNLANIEKEFRLKEGKIREEAKRKVEQINQELEQYANVGKNQDLINEDIRYREINRNIRAQSEQNVWSRTIEAELTEAKIAHDKRRADIIAKQQEEEATETKRLAKEQEDLNLRVIEITKGAKEAEFAREEYKVKDLLNQKLITQKEAAEDLAKKHKEIFDKKEFRSMFIVPIESAWSQLATRFAGGKEAATELTQREIADSIKIVARIVQENQNKNPNKTPTTVGLGVTP
jgi:hypothetical protein